jgi:hypothetical protein
MDKKVLVGVGVVAMVSIIAIFSIFFNSENSGNNPNLNYDDKTWLKIVVCGDDGYTVKLNDKKLYVHVGIASYDPSKIGNCPYAEIRIFGCGVDYTIYTDEGGFAEIPVHYTETGTLTISCKYADYENSVKILVEE